MSFCGYKRKHNSLPSFARFVHRFVYTVPKKLYPDIFSCNLSKHYPRSIIFGTNFIQKIVVKNAVFFHLT